MRRMFFALLLTLTSGVLAVNGDMGTGTQSLTDGSETYPWLIEDLADFDAFATNPNYWAAGVHTKLMIDIDLDGRTYVRAVISPDNDAATNGFQGIYFKGVFHGQGFIVANLKLTGTDYCGLWGFVNGGFIQDLNLVKVDVTGNSSVGGLCGTNSGNITRCLVLGEVRGYDHVGGICGHNRGGTIYKCGAISDINATGNSVGGLCGGNWIINGTSSLTNCYAFGTVTGMGDYVGGLCGYSRSIISNCYAICSVTGNHGVGGLCGTNSMSEIDRVYGQIRNCYAIGTVSGTVDYIGGLCGTSSGWRPLITNCFFLQGAGLDNGYGTPLPENLMKQQSSYTIWDFSCADGDAADWMMLREGEDYPRLAWQEIYPGDIAGLYGVDIVDFVEIARNWLDVGCPANCEDADIDTSGDVGISDLIVLTDDWMNLSFQL